MRKILLMLLSLLYLGLTAQDIGGDYYVAHPDSAYSGMVVASDSNNGSYSQPWATWQKAFDVARAGDTVYFRGGIYKPTEATFQSNITIVDPSNYANSGARGGSGAEGNPICYFNYPGEYPILDCQDIEIPGNYAGILNFWAVHFIHMRGLEVRNLAQQREGMSVQGFSMWMCSNFTIENMVLDTIGGRAMWVASTVGYYGTMVDSIGDTWDCTLYDCADTIHSIPYDTSRFVNIDIFDCIDSISWNPYNTADGIKGDVAKGGVMYFDRIRVWNTCDDGLDISGPGQKILDNCWVFDVARSIPDGPWIDDGNGFKLGGVRDTITMPNWIMRNCISANNYRFAIHELDYSPYYRNNARVYNSVFYGNGYGPAAIYNTGRLYRNTEFYNNISYDNETQDIFIYYYFYPESNNTWDVRSGDPWYVTTDTVTVTNADFMSIDLSQLRLPRKADYSLPDITTFRLASNSDLINMGKDVGMSSTPDIGIDWEYYDAGSPPPDTDPDPTPTSNKQITRSANGRLMVSAGGFAIVNSGTVIPPEEILVSSITVSGAGNATTINTDNGTLQMSATIIPSNATNKVVSWSRINGTGSGSISSTGLLTAIDDGTVTTRATATDGSNIYDDQVITISNQTPPVLGSSIIADHSIVADYDIIPQRYIDSVKTRWVNVVGASHAEAYRMGCWLLAQLEPKYAVNTQYEGTPAAYTTSALRINKAVWGNYDNETGWQYTNGAIDFWTNDLIRTRRKASLQYAHDNGPALYAMIFGWSFDAVWDNVPGGDYDPVYHVRWAGGSREATGVSYRWGLNADDNAAQTSVSMDMYISTMNEYIDYCTANNIPTNMIWSTGTVDNEQSWAVGEVGYQAYMKWQYIRDYVNTLEGAYMIDYADILSHDDNGEMQTTTWTDNNSVLQTFPMIHPDNMEAYGAYDQIGHIGYTGALKIGKATWWLLARMAGWDGEPE